MLLTDLPFEYAACHKFYVAHCSIFSGKGRFVYKDRKERNGVFIRLHRLAISHHQMMHSCIKCQCPSIKDRKEHFFEKILCQTKLFLHKHKMSYFVKCELSVVGHFIRKPVHK